MSRWEVLQPEVKFYTCGHKIMSAYVDKKYGYFIKNRQLLNCKDNLMLSRKTKCAGNLCDFSAEP